MPPVNQMVAIGAVPRQQPWFPTNLLHCAKCDLVQLGLAVDPVIIFPPEYPYTSGTTKLLRDNFADLHAEASAMLKLGPQDLVIDIGSNDGTLLSNFKKRIAFSASNRPRSARSRPAAAFPRCNAISPRKRRPRSGESTAPRGW